MRHDTLPVQPDLIMKIAAGETTGNLEISAAMDSLKFFHFPVELAILYFLPSQPNICSLTDGQ
jgi:hypothetical protein